MTVYRNAAEGLVNPLAASHSAYRSIDVFLSAGNFRPVGRFFESFSEGAVFAAAETAGVPPHVVQGLLRITMIGLLALTAALAVSALTRSASAAAGCCRDAWAGPLACQPLALYPLALAAVLVAGNSINGPIVAYPFMLIGCAVFILAAALVVARDRDMAARRFSWGEAAGLFPLGAVAAASYDLLYVTPAAVAAFTVARAAAAGMPPRDVLRIAALWRCVAFAAGFVAVFAPVRIAIAGRCAEGACYAGSALSLPGGGGDTVLL